MPIISDLPEAKTASLTVVNTSQKDDFWIHLFDSFSNFSRLQRTLAYVLRFVHNLENKNSPNTGILSVDELDRSLNKIVATLQKQCFSKELSEIRKSQPLTNKSIAKLNPFLDSDDLLKVGGRLKYANIPFSQRHPTLLPSRNKVVSMMLRREHVRLGHAGAQTVLSNFRLKFWPLDSVCFRFTARSP